MTTVTGPGLPADGANYDYLDDSSLIEKVSFQLNRTTKLAEAVRTYEPYRDVVDTIENKWSAVTVTSVSKYEYATDDIGRRTDIDRSGAAFPASFNVDYGYNDRNELTSATRTGGGTNTWTFAYDNIGNRNSSASGSSTSYYQKNDVNQYQYTTVNTPQAAQGLLYDTDGNLDEAFIGADIDMDGAVDLSDLAEFTTAYGDPVAYQQSYPDRFLRCDINGNGELDVGDYTTFMSLYGLRNDNNAIWVKYSWDAENRLTGFEPQAPIAGSRKVEFAYDYLGRRIEKKVFDWDDTAEEWESTPSLWRRFVYHGWQMLLEFDVEESGGSETLTVARKYTWGLDLSGSLGGAGGIGGLLACEDTQSTASTTDARSYLYFHDANGNVAQIIDWAEDVPDPDSYDWDADRIVAKYEYGPYGVNQLDPTDSQDPARTPTKTRSASARSTGTTRPGWATGATATTARAWGGGSRGIRSGSGGD